MLELKHLVFLAGGVAILSMLLVLPEDLLVTEAAFNSSWTTPVLSPLPTPAARSRIYLPVLRRSGEATADGTLDCRSISYHDMAD